MSGNFTNSVTTTMAAYTLSIAGTKTNTAAMQFAGAVNGVVFEAGTVEYNGMVAQTVTGGTSNNLVFSNRSRTKCGRGICQLCSDSPDGMPSALASPEESGEARNDIRVVFVRPQSATSKSMNIKNCIRLLIALPLLAGIMEFAHARTFTATVRNQTVSGTDLLYDVYLQRTDTTNIYLADADLVGTFNSANFSSPAVSDMQVGAPGGKLNNWYSISAALASSNRAIINISPPAFSN